MQEPIIGRNKIHPKKLSVWIACASIMMLFAALTSAYLVRRSAGNWLEFPMPSVFLANTGVIIASSLVFQAAFETYKRGKEQLFRIFLTLALLLGFVFVALQNAGWNALHAQGLPLKLNPSSDFVYVVSGLHLAHLLGGLTALIIAVIIAYTQPFKVTQARKLRLEMTLTYWHFMGAVWVYLLSFWLAL